VSLKGKKMKILVKAILLTKCLWNVLECLWNVLECLWNVLECLWNVF